MSKPHQSTYMFAANNPLVFIDPEGNTEFYSLSGWIGTDGVENHKRVIIREATVIKEMERETRKGHTVVIPASLDARPFILPPDDALRKTAQIFGNSQKPTELRRETWSVMNMNPSGQSASEIATGRGSVFSQDGREIEKGDRMALGDIAIHNHPYGVGGFGLQAKGNDVYTATPNDIGLRGLYKYFITVGRIGNVNEEYRERNEDTRGKGVRIQTPNDEVRLEYDVMSDMLENKRGRLGKQFAKRAAQGN